ncbi:MAG: metalloregulator ArsR/SmtB family transcription factor [Thermomicrobiales bacterium]|nr:metalloregulator ArsR/SmtB family transcription factor [Thermomicrobiales bacterium]
MIAEPTRRAILDRLQVNACDVSALVRELGLSQPLVSKHLRVLRDAGVVEVEVVGKRRVYRLADEPLPDVLDWVKPYVRRWTEGFDKLAEALDEDSS